MPSQDYRAGYRICMGYAKLIFHQHFNDMMAVNIDKIYCASLSSDVVTQARVNKFIQEACNYKLTYLFLLDQTKAAGRSTNGQQNISLHTQTKLNISLSSSNSTGLRWIVIMHLLGMGE